jgi:hypothetical protein
MKLLTFFFLLIYGASSAQVVESLASSDTIYVYYSSPDAKKSRVKSSMSENKAAVNLSFHNSEGKEIFLRSAKGKNDEHIACKKRFFTENADKIIDNSFLEEHGLETTFFKILEVNKRKKKIILVTDKSRKKVVLREANISFPEFVEM